MIEQQLYDHLQSCKELEPYLTTYAEQKAIFIQEAPGDTEPGWEPGSQYGRMVFTIDTANDPERKLGGHLTVDLFCEKGKQAPNPEDLAAVVIPLIDGYFFTANEETVSAKWETCDYFNVSTEPVSGATLRFALLAYPNQTTAEPDPIRLVNKWTKKELAKLLGKDLYVIGHSGLPAVWKPTAEKPALYWRNVKTDKCNWIPDTWNCSWQTATLQCHILTPEPEVAGLIARTIDTALTQKGQLLFETRSPLFVDRVNRITLTTDSQRLGQVSIEATYGILREPEPAEKLQHIHIKTQIGGTSMAKETKATTAELKEIKKAPAKEEAVKNDSERSAGQEAGYHIAEFVEAAELLFDTKPVIVRAALKAGGKEIYTKQEAQELVCAITRKEI